jgi:S-adenosylmethionine-diacylgycerolhomoserine-N-methlytransferase
MPATVRRSMGAFMSMNAGFDAQSENHAKSMDRIYRSQRHIYDVTRAYYLLGRDGLLDDLALKAGERVLEIGCGTGRNLVGAAKRYPQARLYGLDISREMLQSAGSALQRASAESRARLAVADAMKFDPVPLFGAARFECVYFSYTLSMIPDWRAAIAQAVQVLKPGGRLHIVDFGGCEALPKFFKSGLQVWLANFHVSPRDGLEAELREMAVRAGAQLKVTRPYRGYATQARLTLPQE